MFIFVGNQNKKQVISKGLMFSLIVQEKVLNLGQMSLKTRDGQLQASRTAVSA